MFQSRGRGHRACVQDSTDGQSETMVGPSSGVHIEVDRTANGFQVVISNVYNEAKKIEQRSMKKN